MTVHGTKLQQTWLHHFWQWWYNNSCQISNQTRRRQYYVH